MRRDDPQITTQGAYRQLDASAALPGPGEGQGGRPRKKQPPRARPGRPSVAAPRGLDETGRKSALGEKVKNPHQLRNPKERLKRKLGPVGRKATGIEKKAKDRSR
jgi:hypothetical protein